MLSCLGGLVMNSRAAWSRVARVIISDVATKIHIHVLWHLGRVVGEGGAVGETVGEAVAACRRARAQHRPSLPRYLSPHVQLVQPARHHQPPPQRRLRHRRRCGQDQRIQCDGAAQVSPATADVAEYLERRPVVEVHPMAAVVEVAGVLPSSIVDAELKAKISVAIFQAGVRTIQEQGELGSWSGGEEQTAYAVILLAVASRVGLFQPIQTQLLQAVRRGSDYLTARPSPPGDYIWVERVT